MSQQVSEIDDLPESGNSCSEFGMILMQPIQCLADNLELAFHRSLYHRVFCIGATVDVPCETSDICASPINIRQQNARVTMHR